MTAFVAWIKVWLRTVSRNTEEQALLPTRAKNVFNQKETPHAHYQRIPPTR